MKILIIKWGALGDVIRTSYILKGLHQKYKNPEIYWFTHPQTVGLLRFNPYISQIVTISSSQKLFREISFDLVISLDEEARILSYLRKINYRRLIGAYLNGSKKAEYGKEAAYWFDMSLISRFGKKKADALKKKNKKEHNQIFAKMLGISIDEPMFFNSSLTEAKIKRKFSGNHFNIGLNSAAGRRWSAKHLLLPETARLVKKILPLKIKGKKVCIYLLGGKEEEERHALLLKQIPSKNLKDAGNNNTLLEFAAIIKNLDYVITSDSLALHLAISQKVPNLSFYAPTPAEEIGTFGTGVKVRATSEDYASYNPHSDNTSITADRVYLAFKKHVKCKK